LLSFFSSSSYHRDLPSFPTRCSSDLSLSPAAFNLTYLAIVTAIVAVTFVLAERLRASPFGRVLRAIRDDEQVAAIAGKHVALFKVKAFAIGAAALGLAGALYAHYTSYIAPDIFVPLLT